MSSLLHQLPATGQRAGTRAGWWTGWRRGSAATGCSWTFRTSRPGQNFATSIEQTLAKCTHLLAVVGPRWLEILKTRAAAGEDLVRHEIAVGMKRGLTVIPVLVGGARMPSS